MLEKEIPKNDAGTTTYKALHLSFWDEREPRYLTEWMYMAHDLWGKIRAEGKRQCDR
jgi:hypothetical protein